MLRTRSNISAWATCSIRTSRPCGRGYDLVGSRAGSLVLLRTLYTIHTFNDSYRDAALVNYLSASLTSMEGEYPGWGFLLCGDFNRLYIRHLTTQFQLKQLVDKPTRGDQILDSVITNLPQLYDANSVQGLPPFDLSDHKVVLVGPKARQVEKGSSRKTVSRRDTRVSRKLELGRYFSSMDWSLFNRADSWDSCSAKLSLLVDTIHIGMDHIMPVKHHRIHVNDAPWITTEFKQLIRLRQQGFNNGDKESYSLYRNAVNRER